MWKTIGNPWNCWYLFRPQKIVINRFFPYLSGIKLTTCFVLDKIRNGQSKRSVVSRDMLHFGMRSGASSFLWRHYDVIWFDKPRFSFDLLQQLILHLNLQYFSFKQFFYKPVLWITHRMLTFLCWYWYIVHQILRVIYPLLLIRTRAKVPYEADHYWIHCWETNDKLFT